jgi:hypothetical protein
MQQVLTLFRSSSDEGSPPVSIISSGRNTPADDKIDPNSDDEDNVSTIK